MRFKRGIDNCKLVNYLESLVVEDRSLRDEITELIKFDCAGMPLRKMVEFVRTFAIVNFLQIQGLPLYWRHLTKTMIFITEIGLTFQLHAINAALPGKNAVSTSKIQSRYCVFPWEGRHVQTKTSMDQK